MLQNSRKRVRRADYTNFDVCSSTTYWKSARTLSFSSYFIFFSRSSEQSRRFDRLSTAMVPQFDRGDTWRDASARARTIGEWQSIPPTVYIYSYTHLPLSAYD